MSALPVSMGFPNLWSPGCAERHPSDPDLEDVLTGTWRASWKSVVVGRSSPFRWLDAVRVRSRRVSPATAAVGAGHDQIFVQDPFMFSRESG
jgi:hypothetical protein